MAASTVTENTSVVLVSSIGTIVYLSSVVYPGHIVTIQDYAGVASQGLPIVVSTAKDIYFADGTFSTFLYNPYSFLTASSKTPTTWQILNNVGFLTTLSNAFVEQLTATNVFVSLVSSTKEYISSATIGRINITQGLELTGNVAILGDITVNGVVDIFSTLNVNQDIYLSTSLLVNGPGALGSTVYVRDDITVYDNISTTGDLIIKDDLHISSSLYANQTLVPRFLSIQTLTMNSINVASGLRTNQGVSVASNVVLGGSLIAQSSFTSQSTLNVLYNTTVLDDVQIQKKFITQTLEVYSSGTVTQNISAYSLEAEGIVSTGNSLLVRNAILAEESTLVEKVLISGSISTNSLIVIGNANLSSLQVQGNLLVDGNTSLFSTLYTSSLWGTSGTVGGSFTVNDHTVIYTFFSTLNNLAVGGYLQIDPFCNVSLKVKGDSYIGGSLVNVSTLEIYGSISTQSLHVFNDLYVQGDISVAGTVKAKTVGAPIEISLSTVTLSNTFSTSNVANIPIFSAMSNKSDIFPNSILAGIGATEGDALSYIHANPTLNIRDTIQDTNTGVTTPDMKTISSVRASTLYNTAILSSFVVGAGEYLNPPIDLSGFLVFGEPDTYKLQFGSFSLLPTSLTFTGGGMGAYYNGDSNTTQPKWVAVGTDATQANTIQYSMDGSSWNAAQTGGFAILLPPFLVGIGNDVVYMSTTFGNAYTPKWLATGRSWSTQPSLQYSPDGMNWAPAAGNVFPLTFYGNRLLYLPSPINPNDGGIALAGGAGGPGNFGIRYTYDGINWVQATAAYGSGEFICRDFTVGANYDLLAVGQDTFNSNSIFKAGACNFASGWSNLSNTPVMPGTYNTIAYGNGFYVLGTSATSGNPLTSMWKSLNLGTWTSIASGGFSGATNRITFDTSVGAFIAVGNDVAGSNVQFSIDGANWLPIGTSFGASVSSIAQGVLPLPDNTTKYFTVNTEARFETAVSTTQLNASTIVASSFMATYFQGDASQISEVNKFSARMGVSSILTQYIAFNSTFTYYDSTFTSTIDVESQLYLAGNNFLSTINFWVATGLNSDSNANVIYSKTIDSWSQSSNLAFQYYGSAVAGNRLIYNPLFVATGADSDPHKTIQYSLDGTSWNPIVRGGFTALDSNGFKTGNTVAYGYFFSTIPSGYSLHPRWIVGGYGGATASTLFYSDDGSNFYTGIGTGDTLSTSITKLKIENNYAVGLNSSNSILNSSNGQLWNVANTAMTFTGFGYGYSSGYSYGWYAFTSNGDLYFSGDNGSNWLFTTAIGYMSGVRDMIYTTNDPNGYWIAIASNSMYITSSPTISWSMVGAFMSQGFTQFRTLAYDSNQGRWFAGGEAQASIKTLWTSTDGIQWDSIVSGGFSSATLSYGVGYSLIKTSTMVMAGGTGAFTPLTETRPQILNVVGAQFPPGPSIYTEQLLSQSNTSNVFNTTVYGLAFTSSLSQVYPYIAVGDGRTPQKTIARTSNLSDWIPAVTGGFSPAGYGAIYYSTADIWIAVGDSPGSTATIQYSADGANWFATNNSGAFPFGGRAITKFRDSSVRRNRLVAVGKGPFAFGGDYTRTVAYSDDGFNWVKPGFNQGFQYAGYGIGSGIVAAIEGVVAVGSAYTTDPSTILTDEASIQFSWDGNSWYTTDGGFNVAGYGVASGSNSPYFYGNRWVAVGENTTLGSPYGYGPTTQAQTIKYSSDGVHWLNAYNSFVYAGYAVTYDPENYVFIAAGKSTSNTLSIMYSGDGQTWNLLQSTTSGFISQQAFGTAYGVFGQEISITEHTPFLEFPKLTIYERVSSLSYQQPSLRLLSTSLIFNETMVINMSSQMMINTFTPVGSNTLTVIGDIQASTFIYRGSEPSYENNIVSSLFVSSLQFTNLLLGVEMTTPSWSYATVSTTANFMAINQQNTSFYTNINDTLFVKKANYTLGPAIGINTISPTQILDVNGTFACSTLSTAIYKQQFVEFDTPAREYILSSNLSIFEGSYPITTAGKNTVYSEPSSLTLNSILSINLSTQRVGCYTTNPQFDFDVQRAGWISTLTTQTVNTKTLFFTLQSL